MLQPLSKPLRASVMMTALFACTISISACQQEPEPSLSEDIASEQAVPMSAEPADPNDATLNEVQADTIADVNTDVTQITYLCSPTLEIEATYKESANQVVLATDQGTITLINTNQGSNPETFDGQSAIDGTSGFAQWRVAHTERASGVLRTAREGEETVNTYECNET